VTRLKLPGLPFFALVGLGLGCCLLGRDRLALAGACCILAHLTTLVGVCLHEEPLPRYFHFTEWLCLLGFFLAGLSAAHFLGRGIAGWSTASRPRSTRTVLTGRGA